MSDFARTPARRVKRGAKRAGIVAGLIIFSVGFCISILSGWRNYEGRYIIYDQANCLSSIRSATLKAEADTKPIRYLFTENGCPGPVKSSTLDEIKWNSGFIYLAISFAGPFLIFLVISFVAALTAAYAISGFGWVAAGFMASEE